MNYDKTTDQNSRAMESKGIGTPSSNGTGVRSFQMDEEANQVVGDLAIGSAQRCPYGLGAYCPLMEAVEGAIKRREEKEIISKFLAVVSGLTVTIIVMVLWVR